MQRQDDVRSGLSLFQDVRQRTEALCQPLETEDYLPQPVAFVSPPKWHLAHTTWFLEEFILSRFLPQFQPYDANFRFLFNSYYNAVGPRIPRDQRGLLSRPSVSRILDYRRVVTEQIIELLTRTTDPDLLQLVEIACHHEQQHQELLLTDIKYTLHCHPLFPVYREGNDELAQVEAKRDDITIDEGVYEIGHQGPSFCFDNETPRHKIYLQRAVVEGSLITNEEYQEFIEAGGYQHSPWWLEEGWHWLQENQSACPYYWHRRDGEWLQFTLAGLQPLNPAAPVAHVNFFEAFAFAEWRGQRLCTEFEWEVASAWLPWGLRWEWTNSAYLPYPGYEKPPGAIGEYNGKFMFNQMILRGASVATPEGHSRNTYRNFFPGASAWQYTGIRLARNPKPSSRSVPT